MEAEERRKQQNGVIPVHAVVGENTKIAVGNEHKDSHSSLSHFLVGAIYEWA